MTWVGLKNYVTVFQVPDLIGTIFNAFWLVVWFSFIPVGLGLVVASVIHRVATGRLGAIARTVLFLPQVIPLVAAGIIWGWLLALPGLVNQILKAVGLGAITRAWLGDFDWALPAVGVIGIWVLLGFCTVLLLTGMTKIDPALYESAQDRWRRLVQGVRRDHRPASQKRDRRVPDRHGDRRAGRVRHRLRLDGRRARQLDGGPRDPDLHPCVHPARQSAWRLLWPSCS